VPGEDVNFSIHLTSEGYIASGLAMFVYIDGQYQCNRHRTDLSMSESEAINTGSHINFRVRQKEEPQTGTDFIGRDWSFVPLRLGKIVLKHATLSLSHDQQYHPMPHPTPVLTYSKIWGPSRWSSYAARTPRQCKAQVRPLIWDSTRLAKK